VQTTTEALETFRGLRRRFSGVAEIPDALIEDIIMNRPLELVWDR
jgi:hypothetical protein